MKTTKQTGVEPESNSTKSKNEFYFISVEDTKKYGIVKAAILGRIKFWCNYNEEKKVNFIDNYYWSGYISSKNFSEQLGMPQKTIEYNIKSLMNDNIIIKGRFNKLNYDKTSWYRLTIPTPQIEEIGECIQPSILVNPNPQIEENPTLKLSIPFPQIEEIDTLKLRKPIPDNLTNNLTNNHSDNTGTYITGENPSDEVGTLSSNFISDEVLVNETPTKGVNEVNFNVKDSTPTELRIGGNCLEQKFEKYLTSKESGTSYRDKIRIDNLDKCFSQSEIDSIIYKNATNNKYQEISKLALKELFQSA